MNSKHRKELEKIISFVDINEGETLDQLEKYIDKAVAKARKSDLALINALTRKEFKK